MFAALIYFLVTLGFLASGYFVIGWTVRAVRGHVQDYFHYSWLTALDFVGLQAAAFLILGLSEARLILHGVSDPGSTGAAVSRVLTSALVTAIVVVRAIRWHQIVRTPASGEPAPATKHTSAS